MAANSVETTSLGKEVPNSINSGGRAISTDEDDLVESRCQCP